MPIMMPSEHAEKKPDFAGCWEARDQPWTSRAQVPGSSYGDRRGQRRKVQLMAAYKFVLGAENTIAVDYITEKFWQLFGSRCGVVLCLHACMRCVLLRCSACVRSFARLLAPYHAALLCRRSDPSLSACTIPASISGAIFHVCYAGTKSTSDLPCLYAHVRRRLPVYLGAPNAGNYAPPGSFINALAHTPAQLAELLRRMDADEAAYNAYFVWQEKGRVNLTAHFGRALEEHVFFGERGDGMGWVCRLCRAQHRWYDWPRDDVVE
jgi:hypothetical protein